MVEVGIRNDWIGGSARVEMDQDLSLEPRLEQQLAQKQEQQQARVLKLLLQQQAQAPGPGLTLPLPPPSTQKLEQFLAAPRARPPCPMTRGL